MRNDQTYQVLVEKMQEVSALEPQSMGPFTAYYHRIVPWLKRSPWKVFFASSFVTTLLLYLVFGTTIVYVVNVLQHGF